MNPEFMDEAIRLSLAGMRAGQGGPFGAVVVKDGKVVGQGYNQVLLLQDPTAHAEIVAIRRAAKHLNRFHLEGCELYTSCEPCPMCMSAIYWAHLDRVFFANTRQDAAGIGFQDESLYVELSRDPKDRKIQMVQLMRTGALQAFEEWKKKDGHKLY